MTASDQWNFTIQINDDIDEMITYSSLKAAARPTQLVKILSMPLVDRLSLT